MTANIEMVSVCLVFVQNLDSLLLASEFKGFVHLNGFHLIQKFDGIFLFGRRRRQLSTTVICLLQFYSCWTFFFRKKNWNILLWILNYWSLCPSYYYDIHSERTPDFLFSRFFEQKLREIDLSQNHQSVKWFHDIFCKWEWISVYSALCCIMSTSRLIIYNVNRCFASVFLLIHMQCAH